MAWQLMGLLRCRVCWSAVRKREGRVINQQKVPEARILGNWRGAHTHTRTWCRPDRCVSSPSRRTDRPKSLILNTCTTGSQPRARRICEASITARGFGASCPARASEGGFRPWGWDRQGFANSGHGMPGFHTRAVSEHAEPAAARCTGFGPDFPPALPPLAHAPGPAAA